MKRNGFDCWPIFALSLTHSIHIYMNVARQSAKTPRNTGTDIMCWCWLWIYRVYSHDSRIKISYLALYVSYLMIHTIWRIGIYCCCECEMKYRPNATINSKWLVFERTKIRIDVQWIMLRASFYCCIVLVD